MDIRIVKQFGKMNKRYEWVFDYFMRAYRNTYAYCCIAS